MSKILVLIRHGHREAGSHAEDNGLSAAGRRHACLVRDFYVRRFARAAPPPPLLASPKRRCQETLAPLAEALGIGITVDPLLDEGGAGADSLSRRVDLALERAFAGTAPLTILCSHGDWIPVAVRRLVGLDLDPAKGSWTEISLGQSGTAALRRYLPDLGMATGPGGSGGVADPRFSG